MRYCVVLPAHNEARHLESVIRGIPQWVAGIIVVDDASTDDTLAVATTIAASDPRTQVIHHEYNRGVGGAMASGFLAALEGNYDVAIKMDADGQMEPNELAALIRPLELGMAEYTKGNRFRRSGRPASMPGRRWVGNVTLSFLTKVASGYWHVFDPQCGFLAIRTSLLPRLRLDTIARDYFFENDMLIRLNVLDARVVDVDTASLYGDEESGVRIGRVSATFPLRLLRGFLWRFVKRHLVNDFGLVAFLVIVGMLLAVFGVTFGAYHWIASAQAHVATPTGTVMIAVVPLIVGVQMVLQALSIEVQDSPGAAETRDYARLQARNDPAGPGDPTGA